MIEVTGPQFPTDSREVVRSFNEDGTANFAQVGVEELSYRGRFGAVATSTSSNDVSIGEKYFTIDVDEGLIRTGDDVLVISLDDPDCYMWGEVIATDTVAEPLRLRIFVDDVSNITITSSNWEIQVVARPKPGIEKDTSLSTVDPTEDGPFTFTITAGKFFPLGGQLLIKPTADRSIALLGKVSAYEGTTLVVNKTVTNATVATDYDSWSIALLDAPISYSQQFVDGLQIRKGDLASSFIVEPGSIMDSTGEVLLTLPDDLHYKSLDEEWNVEVSAPLYGCVVKPILTGTISSSGTTVTGTGTAFLTDFRDSTVQMSGYGTYYSNIKQGASAVISSGGTARTLNANPSNNTSLSVKTSWTVTAGSSYTRNSLLTELEETFYTTYFIYVIRNPTTGDVSISANQYTYTREPDLPSGYTQWRLIGSIECSHRAGSMDYFRLLQPQHAYSVNVQPSNLLNATAMSVLGRDGSSNGGPDWIVAGTNKYVLRRDGSTIGFGVVDTDAIEPFVSYSILGNTTGSTTSPTAFKISDLTEATPVDGDWVLLSDTSASNALRKANVSNFGGGGGAFPVDAGLVTDTLSSTYDLGDLT